MHRQPGYIDGRRTRVGGVPVWGAVPDVLTPGSMEAFGIFEEFLGSTELAAGISGVGWLLDVTATLFSIEDAIPGGAVLLTTGGANEDTGQLTLGDGAGGIFVPAAGKDIWYEARVKTTKTGNNPNYFFGLQDPAVVAAPPANEYIQDTGGARLDNHLCFQIMDTTSAPAPDWTFEGDDSGVPDINGLAIAQDPGVFHTFGFHVVGATRVDVYIDRVLIAAGEVGVASIPDGIGLMPVFFVKAGDGSAEVLSVDYVMCVQLR